MRPQPLTLTLVLPLSTVELDNPEAIPTGGGVRLCGGVSGTLGTY